MHAGSSGRRRLAQTLVTGQGGWTMYSTDSGVTVIHAVPIPNGQVFMYERNGNREQPVSSLPLTASHFTRIVEAAWLQCRTTSGLTCRMIA